MLNYIPEFCWDLKTTAIFEIHDPIAQLCIIFYCNTSFVVSSTQVHPPITNRIPSFVFKPTGKLWKGNCISTFSSGMGPSWVPWAPTTCFVGSYGAQEFLLVKPIWVSLFNTLGFICRNNLPLANKLQGFSGKNPRGVGFFSSSFSSG